MILAALIVTLLHAAAVPEDPAPLQYADLARRFRSEWLAPPAGPFEHGLADPKEALAGASPYLMLFGTVTGGWLSARLALNAKAQLDSGAADKGYLESKIVTARFYAEQLLPRVDGYAPAVTAGSRDLFALDMAGLASS